MRVALLILVLPWLVWAQPTPTSTPVSEKRAALEKALGAEEENEAAPSAKDTSRPAVFSAMIANAQRERAGTPMEVIRRRSIMPWVFSLILLPLYLHIARRRGFRIR